MHYEIRKQEDDRYVLAVNLSRFEAQQLSAALRTAVQRPRYGLVVIKRFSGLCNALKKAAEPPLPEGYGPGLRIRRPSGKYPNELDMDHVLNGRPPYPVLSARDMRTVYPLLETKGLSASEIAERLHVAARTVNRYRKKLREGERV